LPSKRILKDEKKAPVVVLMDVTECEIQRPKKNREEEQAKITASVSAQSKEDRSMKMTLSISPQDRILVKTYAIRNNLTVSELFHQWISEYCAE